MSASEFLKFSMMKKVDDCLDKTFMITNSNC